MSNSISPRTEAIEQVSKKRVVSLRQVERMTILLDSQFRIPGTNLRFGLDPIIGLVPVLGDLITFFVSIFLIFAMRKYGASRRLMARMALNTTIDALIGTVPALGSLFDIWFQCNQRNLKLMHEHYFYKSNINDQEPFDNTVLLFFLGLFAAVIYMSLYFFFDGRDLF